MAIITVSRGSYVKGKEVAEGVAKKLGYNCVSRDILIEASDKFNIPEMKLSRAIHDSPSLLDRFTLGQQAYVSYIQCALVLQAQKDNLVYHGLAGHVLLTDIPHMLKVRIIADMENRVDAEMRRSGLSKKEASNLIRKDDNERRKWTQRLYGVDPWDPYIYDLVIKIDKNSVKAAIDLIVKAVSQKSFTTTAESQQKINDMAIACQVKSQLVDLHHEVIVSVSYGNVLIFTKSGSRKARKFDERVKALSNEIEGIFNIEIRTNEIIPEGVLKF